MSAKAETKKQQKKTTTSVVSEKVVIEEKSPEKDVILKETEHSSSSIVEEELPPLEKGDSDDDDKNSVINEDEGLISSTEYINFVNKQIENTRNLMNALKSIPYFTKTELKEVDKVEKLLQKANEQYSKTQSKVFFSLAANSAPKAKKEIKLDLNGNKITEGKNPVVWYDFAKEGFKLESNDGFGNKYLQHVWELIKSVAGTKNGSSIIISNPGPVNTFFQNIKRVMEERGLNTEKEKEVYALIEKGVLANTDITKFSKYCYEEKEKKPKATKKPKAV